MSLSVCGATSASHKVACQLPEGHDLPHEYADDYGVLTWGPRRSEPRPLPRRWTLRDHRQSDDYQGGGGVVERGGSEFRSYGEVVEVVEASAYDELFKAAEWVIDNWDHHRTQGGSIPALRKAIGLEAPR